MPYSQFFWFVLFVLTAGALRSPMHPPDQRDPRFLFPYPAAHSMRLQVLPVLLILTEWAMIGRGAGQGGMWDHRSTRKPPPLQPQAASRSDDSEAVQLKPQAATRDELDSHALSTAEKRRPEELEMEGVGSSSKRRCGASERPQDGRGADGVGLNGHEKSNIGMQEAHLADSAPQLLLPDCENMEDR